VRDERDQGECNQALLNTTPTHPNQRTPWSHTDAAIQIIIRTRKTPPVHHHQALEGGLLQRHRFGECGQQTEYGGTQPLERDALHHLFMFMLR